jgi:guanyl-specific ribonuclease Sa
LFLGLFALVVGNTVSARGFSSENAFVRVGELPEQARETLAMRKRRGPYPYAQHGAVFANREHTGQP